MTARAPALLPVLVFVIVLFFSSSAFCGEVRVDSFLSDVEDENDDGCFAKGAVCTSLAECISGERDYYIEGRFCKNGMTCCAKKEDDESSNEDNSPATMEDFMMEDGDATATATNTTTNTTTTTNSTTPAPPPPVSTPPPNTDPVSQTALRDLLPYETGSMSYDINDYGPELQNNKAVVQAAFKKCGCTPDEQVLIMACGMLETNHMDLSERDASKDGRTDGSKNVSPFNLSVDMVSRLGYPNPDKLNEPGHVADAVCVMKKGIEKWGASSFLDYIRGGYTGWKDHHSYGCAAYRSTIATIMSVIQKNPSLMWDSRRVDIYLPPV